MFPRQWLPTYCVVKLDFSFNFVKEPISFQTLNSIVSITLLSAPKTLVFIIFDILIKFVYYTYYNISLTI